MELQAILDYFTIERMMEFFKDYKSFGPLLGIALPLLEAFLPFLPLVVFIVANANSYGLWFGFLYSWIGSCLGALILFFLVRKYGQERFFRFLSRHQSVQKMMGWIERHGFGPLFILLCFPFTPSAAVNVVAGLSKVSIWQFCLAVMSGKFVMIFLVSFIGYDLRAIITQPARTLIAAIVIFLLWLIGKQVEKRLNVRMLERKRSH
ncbi:TVP38/TMEM64 family protein [Metabacillus indicus]|uniref:TVP38/TMEM64 family protein n=1 Tax=Metabacillus indicus TaxID=246786 RepID=UPI0029FFED41|nr:TVP38/TMEM64 family protein [Metabacillus indicus]MDX8289505.1 TVP38/TMEM64 family protein [Metabacillus indicus]